VPLELPEPDEVPEPEDETPPEELLADDAEADETGTAAPGTTMTCGSDPEPPHATNMPTERHPHAAADRTLARWVMARLDMDVRAPLHPSDHQETA
jgi:hypothetical protein